MKFFINKYLNESFVERFVSTIFDDKMQHTNVIPLWKMERVFTDWKTIAKTNIKNDIFMIMSMLFFEGTVDFQCPILNTK